MADNWQGKILYHTDFQFKDGYSGEKLIIVLNNPQTTEDPYLVCRVTSNDKNKPNTFGCHAAQSVFFLPSKHDFFAKDTWLQLHEIFPFEAKTFLKDHFGGELQLKGKLQEITISEIMNCIKKIKDIERIYRELILK